MGTYGSVHEGAYTECTRASRTQIFWFHSRGCMHIVEMDELLTSLVREKSAIWDAKDKKHLNKDYVKKMWMEIATELDIICNFAKMWKTF